VSTPVPIRPFSIPTEAGPEVYQELYPDGYKAPYPWYSQDQIAALLVADKGTGSRHHWVFDWKSALLGVVVGAAVGVAATYDSRRGGYDRID
jgi:hypothetical protein